MTKENRLALFIALGVIFAVGTAVGLLAYFTHGSEYASLRKGLKEKNGLDVKSLALKGEIGQLQIGTVTTEQGQTYPIAVHIGQTHNPTNYKQITVTTQWILGKQPSVAEGEIRDLVKKLGFEVASLQLQRNPNGVGYLGEATANSGEVIEISEDLKGPPYTSAQLAEMRPSSYDRWIRNTLERELKEEVASVSEFVPKDKSWATEEEERQERLRAEQAARRKEEYERRMEAIRRSGRQPTLGETLLGLDPIQVPNDLMKQLVIDPNAAPPSVPTYKSATATTKTGRVMELELELRTSTPRSINLSWRERTK